MRKRLWCWEGLGAGAEGDDRGWDGWMASLTRWTCVWVNSGSWWWPGRPGMLWFKGSQRVRHDWVTELKWRIYQLFIKIIFGNISILCTYKLSVNRTSVWVVMERQKWHVCEPWGIRENFSEEVISEVNPKDWVDMQRIWDLSWKFHQERNINKLQKQNEQLSVNGK